MVFLRNKIYQKNEKKIYFNRIIILFSVER
jgi:hypothetical protein